MADVRLPVVTEWHPTRNGELTPSDVAAGSNRSVWWRCTADPKHQWREQVNNRTRGHRPSGCPYCKRAMYRPRPGRTLAEKFPEIAKEWHPSLNLPLRLKDISVYSGRRVWWRCRRDKSHVWGTNVN